MSGLLLRIRTWWETADRTQKAVTIFGSLFLVLLLGGTFYFASKPKMAIAFSNLDSAEVGTVADEITKMGIAVEYDAQGNVQVPSDKVPEVKAKLALAHKLPSPGHLGPEELSKIGMLNTPTVEAERLKSILEDELAQSIETVKGVQKARVHIALGDNSPFLSEKKQTTASVFVSQGSGEGVTPDQAKGIAMLVANGVSDLTPEKVFVLDNAGHSLYDGSTVSDGGIGAANQLIAAQATETNRRERDLQQALDTTFGRGNTLVKVNLELDFDKTDKHETIHPPSEAVTTEHSTTETMTGDNSIAGGIAGVTANITPSSPPPGTVGKGYVGKTKEVEHPEDVKTTDTHLAVGTVKSMAITTLVNSSNPNLDSAKVDQFVKGYLGPKASDPNFTATVTPVAFDQTAQQQAVSAQKASQTRDNLQQIISLLPIAALIFVGFMVVKAITKAAKSSQTILVGALPGGGTMALERGEHPTPAEGAMHALEAQEQAEIAAIAEKLNMPLEQIKKMSDEKPENVAMLIKSWLLEDRR